MKVQERCRLEIVAAFPALTDMPTMADRARLLYTCATITEIQRCANIAPINIKHRTTQVSA